MMTRHKKNKKNNDEQAEEEQEEEVPPPAPKRTKPRKQQALELDDGEDDSGEAGVNMSWLRGILRNIEDKQSTVAEQAAAAAAKAVAQQGAKQHLKDLKDKTNVTLQDIGVAVSDPDKGARIMVVGLLFGSSARQTCQRGACFGFGLLFLSLARAWARRGGLLWGCC
jgi:hypothetical protein